eukprot:Awhi_evm1s5579
MSGFQDSKNYKKGDDGPVINALEMDDVVSMDAKDKRLANKAPVAKASHWSIAGTLIIRNLLNLNLLFN